MLGIVYWLALDLRDFPWGVARRHLESSMLRMCNVEGWASVVNVCRFGSKKDPWAVSDGLMLTLG